MKRPLAYDPARPGIDLHVHSTASDGTLTPSELLAMALEIGLSALAITDHDTLTGTAAAMAAGIPSSLHFLTGIEISAAAPAGFGLSGSIHILGYGIDPEDQLLNAVVDDLQRARRHRTPKIIARLRTLGINVDDAAVAHIVGHAAAGRPHIAQLLVRQGKADSIDDAFDRFLGRHKPAYVEKYRVPAADAIAAINHAGGIAVLAHPYVNGLNDPDAFETLLVTLQQMGLGGIEAYYPCHPEAVVTAYCRLAAKHGLLVTGGTDFHGAVTPDIRMGTGDGRLHVPAALYEQLAAHLESRS